MTPITWAERHLFVGPFLGKIKSKKIANKSSTPKNTLSRKELVNLKPRRWNQYNSFLNNPSVNDSINNYYL